MPTTDSRTIVVQLLPHHLQVAVIHHRRLEHYSELSLDPTGTFASRLAPIIAAAGADARIIAASATFADRTLQLIAARTPPLQLTTAGLVQIATELPPVQGGAPSVTACASDLGRPVPFSATQPWLLGSAPSASLVATRRQFVAWGLATPGVADSTLALLGAIHRSQPAEPVLVWDLGPTHAHLVILDRSGLRAVSPCAVNLPSVMEAIQAELGLRFLTAAAKLFASGTYDYNEAGPKIVARLLPALRAAFPPGQPRPSTLCISGLGRDQTWFSLALGEALGLQPWTPDWTKQGVELSPEWTAPRRLDSIAASAAGLFYLGSEAAAGQSAWLPSWSDEIPDPKPALAAAPAPIFTTPPMPVTAPLPATAPRRSGGLIAAGILAVGVVIAFWVWPKPSAAERAGAATTSATAPAIPSPAPASAAIPTPADVRLLAWAFDDAAGTELNAATQSGTLAGQWSAPLAGVVTDSTGRLQIRYNNTSSTSRLANFGQPPQGFSSGLLRLELTLAPWDFRGTAALTPAISGNAIPLFGFGFDTGSATVGRLNFEYSATANGGAGGIVLDYYAGVSSNDAVLATLPLVTTQALTVVLDLDKTRATYRATYGFADGPAIILAKDVALDATYASREPNAAFLRVRGDYTASTFQIERLNVTLNPTTPAIPAVASGASAAPAAIATPPLSATVAAEARAAVEAEAAAAEARLAAEQARRPGRITLRTLPAGALITIADRPASALPDALENLPPGEHRLTLTLAGHEPRSLAATVRPGETTALGEIRLSPLPGVIEVDAPAGLRYELRRDAAPAVLRDGTSPARLADLPPADYTLTFLREGWRPRVVPVRLEPGASKRAEPEFATGRATLRSEPSGAEVWLEGRAIGRTPLELEERDPAALTFRLTLPGHDEATIGGLIEPGGTLALVATLDPADRIVPAALLSAMPRAISQPSPELSAEVLRAGGKALISLIVDREGLPGNIRVQQTDNNAFAEQCVAAVALWRFSPALTKTGQPANVRVQVPFQVAAR